MSTVSCSGCEAHFDVLKEIINDNKKFIDWLCEHNVIKTIVECPRCKLPCTRSKSRFFCKKTVKECLEGQVISTKCTFTQSIRKGTWFSMSKMPIEKIFVVTLYWAYENRTHMFLVNKHQISSTTAVKWSKYLREVCIRWCESRSERIGGSDVIIEIDEAKYSKREPNSGGIIDGQWVFGGYERDTCKFFVVAVSDRNAETLLDVIKQWVEPGTTIFSDCWKTYKTHGNPGYQLVTARDGIKFMNRKTVTCTQQMQRAGDNVFDDVLRDESQGCNYYGHLCEYLWRRSVPHLERAHSIFSIISEQYS